MVCASLCSSVCAQAVPHQVLLAQGQGPSVDAPTSFVEASTPVLTKPSSVGDEHRFWDKRNIVLFTAAAALNGADFAATRANLQSGGQELNPVVRIFGRSTAGLAVNFFGETASMVAISYFLHKTDHHRLERMASMVNIGTSSAAASYSLTHH